MNKFIIIKLIKIEAAQQNDYSLGKKICQSIEIIALIGQNTCTSY